MAGLGLVRDGRAVPAEDECNFVQRALANLRTRELAVDKAGVVLERVQQRQAAVNSELDPTQIQMCDGIILAQYFRDEDHALAIDAIVAKVQVSDGGVRLEHITKSLDARDVFPDGVPLEVQAPQTSVEFDTTRKCDRPLALHVIAAQVKRLDEDVVAEKPSDLDAPIVANGGVSQTDAWRVLVHLEVVQQMLQCCVHRTRSNRTSPSCA